VTSTTTRVNKIGTVVIPVADQDRAIEFYTDKLGFQIRTDIPFGNGYRWVEVAVADEVTTLALAPPPQGKPTGNHETGIGLQTDDIDAYHAEILNVTIRERGVPRLGTGVSQQRGGDNVPSDTWIFPLVVGYDELVQKSHYAPCPPSEPFCVEQLVTETETYHWTEKENAQLAHSGAWSFYLVTTSATCEPAIASCPT
jgi:catechol 2,3-dioxygenase-like lactoylglutathione lyase family enzyme